MCRMPKPCVEYRNGFTWAALDERQQYVGVPNSDRTRYANFFSGDARVSRNFKVSSKYTVTLSLTGYNLTNHFNPEQVHGNSADPAFGYFFGHRGRRFTIDFDFLF